MKDLQKKRITRNYLLLRRVESWKCCRVTAFICLQRDPNKYEKYKFKKTIFPSSEIVKWNSFMLFLLMMMNSAAASLQVLWMSAACVRYIHSNGRYGSARVGASGPEERWRSWNTQYRNTVRKIGIYRNTVSKIDEIPIPHLFSVMLT